MKKIKKPANLIYGVNARPNLYEQLLLAFQHVGLLITAMVFVNMIANIIELSSTETINLISISLLISGVATFLQALNKGPVGSGYYAPEAPGASLFPAYMLAVTTGGGLSLILGITFYAGLVQLFFSRIIKKLRILFPAEISGLVVTMIGFSMITYSIKFFFGFTGNEILINKNNIIVGITTLSVIIIFNIWTKNKLRLFSVLLGMLAGYITSFLTGIITFNSFTELSNLPVFNIPYLSKINFSIHFIFIFPVIIAAAASTLKCFGDIVSCQKINDAEWKKPDLNSVSKGILAESISTIISALSGGLGLSTSSANIGLSAATGATSRIIAISHSIIFILLAFFPKFSGFLALMPQPVIGAIMLFAVCFMIVTGLSIIMSRMLDVRKIFIIGFSMIFGLSVDLLPELYINLPPVLKVIFSSSLNTSVMLALLLNLIFIIGASQKRKLIIQYENFSKDLLYEFFENSGASFGARKEVIYKAMSAVNEFVESSSQIIKSDTDIMISLINNEFFLNANIIYTGEKMIFPDIKPSTKDIIENENALKNLSGYIIKKISEKVEITGLEKNQWKINIVFET
jgi:xanthine permease XanP